MQKYRTKLLKIIIWLPLLLLLTSILIVSMLRWVDPPTSAFMLAYQLQNDNKLEQQWQSLDNISPWLQVSVIASEDQKFADHFGFDLEAIKYALRESSEHRRGASTISQQVAKNLFLWNGRSYIRKAIEAWFTLLIETIWPKKRILEIYLNIAEFGPGIYGAEAAAKRFFNISAHKINPRQAGLLAAILPNPKNMSAAKPSASIRSRATTIYRRARQLGGISYLKTL